MQGWVVENPVAAMPVLTLLFVAKLVAVASRLGAFQSIVGQCKTML